MLTLWMKRRLMEGKWGYQIGTLLIMSSLIWKNTVPTFNQSSRMQMKVSSCNHTKWDASFTITRVILWQKNRLIFHGITIHQNVAIVICKECCVVKSLCSFNASCCQSSNDKNSILCLTSWLVMELWFLLWWRNGRELD